MITHDFIHEDWLTEVLLDSLDMDWTARDGAKAIMRALDERGMGEGSAFPRTRKLDQLFFDAIHAATPNGEWIAVQYHPNGDWSVAHSPLAPSKAVETAAALPHKEEGRD